MFNKKPSNVSKKKTDYLIKICFREEGNGKKDEAKEKSERVKATMVCSLYQSRKCAYLHSVKQNVHNSERKVDILLNFLEEEIYYCPFDVEANIFFRTIFFWLSMHLILLVLLK